MVKFERPPNFEQVLAAFPDACKPGVIFAYGEHIYVPDGKMPPPALIAHETVHLLEQRRFVKPEIWWDCYIADPEFRYNQELLAHAAEFKAQAHGLDGNHRAKLMMATARRLIGPLYNYDPPRGTFRAVADLQEAVRK